MPAIFVLRSVQNDRYSVVTYIFFIFNSLGSTRFFKVARARTREGLVVVKVFAVHDPSLPLAEHKERILKIKEQLASAFNCLPFQRVIVSYYIVIFCKKDRYNRQFRYNVYFTSY